MKKTQPALQHLDIALSMNKHSSDILIARSKCLIAEGQWEEALRSAENILELEANNFQALLVKAESLYYTSQFEYALLNFHRGQVRQGKMFKLFSFFIGKYQHLLSSKQITDIPHY